MTRTVFQRDRDRIIHSRPFRRLMHKTQVFVTTRGDHPRTRLTHTLEVAQIARTIARSLGMNEDLTEAISLAHDFGHPPFGHAGEKALRKRMALWNGFDHNLQTLRLVTSIESRYPNFAGLNLTWETLEGIVKHNGPFNGEVPAVIRNYCRVHDLEVQSFASAEAQIASLADDIAYNCHDIDDGLTNGILDMADLRHIDPIAQFIAEIDAEFPHASPDSRSFAIARRLVNHFVRDVIVQTGRNIADSGVNSADDVRWFTAPIISFSDQGQALIVEVQDWLYRHFYNNHQIKEQWYEADCIVGGLFESYRCNPDELPDEWAMRYRAVDEPAGMRLIADFIAGMTDRFADAEFRRISS